MIRGSSAYGRRPRSPGRRGCLPLTVVIGILLGWVLIWFGWLNPSGERLPEVGIDDFGAAQNAFNQGDLDGAIALSRAVLSSDQHHTEAVILLVRALVYRSYSDYNRTVDRQVALDITESAVRLLPGHADVLAARAFALQVNRRHEEAHRVASHALRLNPDHTLARVALALAYAGAGSFDNAQRESERAVLESDPRWRFDALRARAIILSDTGRYTDAGRTVLEAIEINNRLPLTYFERALYALQIGDFNTATVAYFQVLSQDPGNIKARLRMCELSSLLREVQTALNYCLEVTQRAPAWADGWYRLGREYYLMGDFIKAQKTLNQCTALHHAQGTPLNERPFECWYLQGQSAEQTGDCPALHALYAEFTAMVAQAEANGSRIVQTWTYPPEGPPACATDDNSGDVSRHRNADRGIMGNQSPIWALRIPL